MAKSTNRASNASSRTRAAPPAKARSRAAATPARAVAEQPRPGWATDLVFDVREPKLAVSLRLDADVLRFFRGFGAGYQTRINRALRKMMEGETKEEKKPSGE